jgi:uncharacterized protein DUF5615
MAAAKVYLDEDVHPFIASALRLRGWDVLATVEARRCGTSDREQVRFATLNGCSFLTYNVQDLPRIHYEMIAAGESHAGIIVATQDNPRRTIRALLNMLANVSAEEMRDSLIYVNNWIDMPPA